MESQNKLAAGDAAPAFNLNDDQEHSLESFSGKEGMLIIFMCNHCPYVKAKTVALNQLQQKFGDKIAMKGHL